MSSMINFFRGIWLIQVQQKQPHGRITSCKHSFQDADHLLPVRRCFGDLPNAPAATRQRRCRDRVVGCRSMAHLGSANAAHFPQGLGEARTRYHWFRRITTESTAVAAWGVSEGEHPIVNGPLVSRNTGKTGWRGAGDDREPRSFWAGPDALPRGGPLRGSIHPPPGAQDPPPAFTPRVMNEQGLPSARDSQRIFISFHFWPFWYSANPQGLACIIISEDQNECLECQPTCVDLTHGFTAHINLNCTVKI